MFWNKCNHKWSAWSEVVQISDYFAQRRYCTKCNECQQRFV